jgi:CDP-glycerol glycerophosphotransferase
LVEVHKRALEAGRRSTKLQLHFAKALLGCNRLTEAETVLHSVVSDNQEEELQCHNMLAKCLERQGAKTWLQVDLLEQVIASDLDNANLHFRLGAAKENLGWIDGAVEAYRKATELIPENSHWHYRLGHVLELAGLVSQADIEYARSLELDGSERASLLGVGLYHEQRGLWEAAGRAYEERLQNHANHGQLWYRLGFARSRCFDWARAVVAYRRALSLDKTNPNCFFRLGISLEHIERWAEAASAYTAALARKNEFSATWRYRLGYALEMAGDSEGACKAYEETRILKAAHGFRQTKFNRNRKFRRNASYVTYMEDYSVRKDTILYESYGGRSISGNAYAIFEGLLDRSEFDYLVHVWVVENDELIPSHLRARHDVIFVRKGSDLYLRYLATAKYLINNSTFADYFVRRPEQRYLNTWHGTPFKTLGLDIKTDPLQRANAARNLLHATHLLSPNHHTSRILVDRFGLKHTFRGKLAEVGYPRIDRVINPSHNDKRMLKERLGVDPKKPVVLFAPTFRGYFHHPEVESERLIADLKVLTDALSCELLFRGHYAAEKALQLLDLPVTVTPQSMDTCSLLSIVDILVTDYSSILFDFIPTRRPIFLYVHDLEDYKQSRGLYFDLEELPAYTCRDLPSLTYGIASALTNDLNPHPLTKESVDRFCPHEDGKATMRAIQFFFDECDDYLVERPSSTKLPILFSTGAFNANGITASAKNLIASLVQQHHPVTVALNLGAVRGNLEREAQLAQLPAEVEVVLRSGSILMTPEEDWVANHFHNHYRLTSDEMFEVLGAIYRREYRRVFGGASFEAQIEFSGYQPFWAGLFAFGGDAKRAIYLHSDMYREWTRKYPLLERVFHFYPLYDRLVSVSKRADIENKNSLAQPFSVSAGKFVYVHNTLDYDRSLAMADAPEDNIPPQLMRSPSVNFITVGRLSVEKRHDKLLAAFKRLLAEMPSAKLFIVGDGPLYRDLATRVRSLGLGQSVFLLGYRDNPYVLMRHASCFVLSSDHEGQPMVLLEALALGMPIVSTDIPGSRSVLEGGYGLLVENSVEGLAAGMLTIASGKFGFRTFDPEGYQQEALTMFRERVLTPQSGAEANAVISDQRPQYQ